MPAWFACCFYMNYIYDESDDNTMKLITFMMKVMMIHDEMNYNYDESDDDT